MPVLLSGRRQVRVLGSGHADSKATVDEDPGIKRTRSRRVSAHERAVPPQLRCVVPVLAPTPGRSLAAPRGSLASRPAATNRRLPGNDGARSFRPVARPAGVGVGVPPATG